MKTLLASFSSRKRASTAWTSSSVAYPWLPARSATGRSRWLDGRDTAPPADSNSQGSYLEVTESPIVSITPVVA
jgi:hypothetical protein